MKLLFALLAVASWLAPGFAHSQSQTAESSLQPVSMGATAESCPQWVFDVVPFAHTEDFNTSVTSIGQTLVNGNAHNSTSNGFGLGLVRAERDVQVDVTTQSGCRVVKASLGYVNSVLFVGRELRANACAFNHVREHEGHHVELYRQFMDETVPARLSELHDELQSEVAGLSNEDAKQVLQSRLFTLLKEIVPAQNAFDSEEEYDRNSRVCSGAIRRIVRAL